MRVALLIACVIALVACGRDDEGFTRGEFKPTEVTDEIRDFRRAAEALLLRDEHDAREVGLQYIQIPIRIDGPGESRPRLTLQEAEARAADVFAKALAGEDFDRLVLHYSYEGPRTGQRPGAFIVVRESASHGRGPTVMSRSNFPKAVGDALWRLEPGEIGAVERHPRDADDGYYVLRRLTRADIDRDDPRNIEPVNDAVRDMRAAAEELLARQERDEERVTVQHILVARFSSGSGGPDRSLPRLNELEAELKAAEVFAEALTTDDFDALVRRETYDALQDGPPGVYALVRERENRHGDEFFRKDMVEHFWQAAWRLEVGEVGVILYHRGSSPFGYHIIRRIE